MKPTGITRKLDDLGRIVIPMELRRLFGIHTRDYLEIYVEDDKIILQKCEPSCVFCGNIKNLISHREKYICKKCLNSLARKS